MKKLIHFVSIALFTLVSMQCEQIIQATDEQTDDDTNGDTAGEISAAALLDSANKELGIFMNNSINNPPEDPFDADYSKLSDIQDLYNQVLDREADNPTAHFGAGLTELLLILQDGGQFREELERWEAFLDTTRLFAEPVNSSGGTGKIVSGQTHLYAKNPFSIESAAHLSPQKYIQVIMSLPKFAQEDIPRFSDWQNLIETVILGRVNTAISHFNVVQNSSDFTFTITPEMQGNSAADSLELDLTEVYIFNAILHGLSSISNIAIAYSVDLQNYDSTAIVTHFDQGSGDFLTARNPDAMPAARDSLETGIQNIIDALHYLENENDNQEDDIIIIASNENGYPGITPEEIEEVRSRMLEAKLLLNNTLPIEGDYNSDGMQEEINVNISRLFEIDDFKTLIPNYSVSVQWDTSSLSTKLNFHHVDTDFVPDVSGVVNYQYGKVYDLDEGAEWTVGENSPEIKKFQSYVDSTFSAIKTEYGDDLYHLGVVLNWSSYPDELEAGETYDITGIAALEYKIYDPDRRATPVFMWDAANFEEWKNDWSDDDGYGDPTFNGIFPDISNGQEFVDTFGISAEDYQIYMVNSRN